MDSLRSQWVRGNCLFAMPHLTLDDPSDEVQLFDANAEFIGTTTIPPGWDEADWSSYSAFLADYYQTTDKKEIMRRLLADEMVPVWAPRSRRVRLLSKQPIRKDQV